MSGWPIRGAWGGGRGLEALALGLAGGAALCGASVCLVASFRPAELSAPYWTGLPALRTDTCGIAALLAGAVCFTTSEYLRLRRRRDRVPDRRPPGGAAGLAVRAVAETVAIIAAGLVMYVSVNSITHPATLDMQVTHLTARPTEGTARVLALLVCAGSISVLRYLQIGPPPARGARPPAVRDRRARTVAGTVIAIAIAGFSVTFLSARFIRLVADHSPPAGFGIADPSLIDESPAVQASQLAAMKSIGITSIRLDADWAAVQPRGPGTFDWAQLDQVVHSVRAAGLSVDLIIRGCPPWAAVPGTRGDPSAQPASPAQYATWAAEVAARYAPERVNLFEIWNEPNNSVFWQPAPNPAAYTADLVAAYSAIKKVDPAAFIISGGLAPGPTQDGNYSPVEFLQQMYAYGAKGSFDALGFHPYSYPALPDTYQAWSGWSQMAQTKPSLRSVMSSHGDAGKPIWITEFGAPSGGPGGVGTAAQATALRQVIAQVETTTWIGACYIYTWQDSGTHPGSTEDWFGLLTATGAPKPAYRAVADAVK